MLTVLIVDDERIERSFLRKILEKYNDQYLIVGEASTGNEAVQIAEKNKPDIIIMDINMPFYNGLQAAKLIKEKSPNQIIILNSAYAEFEFAQQAVKYNLDAYLLKPAQEEEIFSTIANCVRKKKLECLVNGSISLSFSPKRTYPFEIVDRLLIALTLKDILTIKKNVVDLFNFFKAQQQQLDDYRLYIINIIFSVEQKLNEISIPDNLLLLLESNRCLLQISQSTTWYDILSYVEEYFSRLIMLLEGYDSNNQSCTEIVAQYIEKHFQENITLENLAQIVHLSPTYLSRVFHQEKGVAIRTYINQQRMEQAKYLLLHSNLPIKEIAEDCGFINISHFYRVFKKYISKSPADIRKGRS